MHHPADGRGDDVIKATMDKRGAPAGSGEMMIEHAWACCRGVRYTTSKCAEFIINKGVRMGPLT